MKVPARVDVLVAGGGPAGAAAALALGRHAPSLQVVVVQPEARGAAHVGETLHPAAWPLLQRLGVWEDVRAQGHLEAVGTVSAWGGPEPVSDDHSLQPLGSGLHLDRRRYDQQMLEAACSAGGARLRDDVAHVRREDDGFAVKLASGVGLRARFLVDATGRRALVARQLGAQRVYFDHMVAAVQRYHAPDDSEARTLVEAGPQGWGYVSRIPGTAVLAAFCTDGDLARGQGLRQAEGLERALGELPLLRERLARATPLGNPQVLRADSSTLDVVADEGWVAVGDAALAVDPLSGQGLVKALRHGWMAAYAAGDTLIGKPLATERFRQRLVSEVEGYLEGRWQIYRQEQRFAADPFWRRRQPLLILAPSAVLRRGAVSPLPSMHLPRAELALLVELAASGRAAHELVFEARRSGVRASARRVVLGLQALVRVGALELDEGE